VVKLVNGFVCHDCSDVEKAKKGVDPAKSKAATDEAAAARDRKKTDEASGRAVGFADIGVNQPSSVGGVGVSLNLLA
jgi:hypothetical protein